MNGSDIRLLAERAAVLEDRTPDRLVELHERVAVVRRRRRVTVAVGAVAAVLAVLVATLAIAGLDPDKRTPSPAPDPVPEPRADAHRPADGTCWAMPPATAVDPDHLYDDSPQVPCTEAHSSETVVVLTLSEPTLDEATKQAQALCREYVVNYIGIDPQSWVPWGWSAYLPSQEQIDDGASWVRCDAVFPGAVGWARARVTSISAEGVADAPTLVHWACYDRRPTTDAEQQYVPCDRPHAYEETGRLAYLSGLTSLPTAQERTRAEAACDDLPDRLAGLEVGAAWDPEDGFVQGGDLAAICFVHDPDGGLLPAIHDADLKEQS